YDYRNFMIEARPANASPVSYVYDPLGRLVQRSVGSAITRFFYDQNNVVEESQLIGAARQTTATYVWGGLESRLQPVTSPTIPAPPIRDVPPAEAGTPNLQLLSAHFGGSDYAYSSDDLGTALALSDPLGRVAERYEYGDFGQP